MTETTTAANAADAATTTTSTAEDASANKGGKPDYTPPATQADLDKIVADRITRERGKYADYDELKAKAAKLAEIEESQKTEAQKTAERQAALERENETLKVAKLRSEIAEAMSDPSKGLLIPASLLTGSTKEEIEASAAALIEFTKGAKPAVGSHLPNQDKSPQKQASSVADTARKLFGGQ